MRQRSLLLLLLVVAVAAASFWWQAEHAATGDATIEPLALPADAGAEEKLTLTREAADAVRAENDELSSRIHDLESQAEDARKLIELKAARLQALEKPETAQ